MAEASAGDDPFKRDKRTDETAILSSDNLRDMVSEARDEGSGSSGGNAEKSDSEVTEFSSSRVPLLIGVVILLAFVIFVAIVTL